ncbi:MAG: GNAT family N-acetyltransferase [Nitrososphaeraceae archaeon]
MDLDIDNLNENESSFCSLWSRTHQKIDSVELFLNPKLGDDYFFNRLNINNSCPNIIDILNSIKSSHTNYHDSLYLHLICNNENCVKFNIPKFGTMKILGLDVNRYVFESGDIDIDLIDRNHLYNWIDVFCKSFDSAYIKDEVTNIISKHYQKLTLLVAHHNLDKVKSFAGCCLLYEKKENIGLYCLGTIQHFRRKGVARELIASAVRIAKNNGHNLLIVQTLTKEGYEEFYKKLGFRTIYEKMLYSYEMR